MTEHIVQLAEAIVRVEDLKIEIEAFAEKIRDDLHAIGVDPDEKWWKR